MKKRQILDLSILKASYDVKETKLCKTGHRLQWIELDGQNLKWQHCTGCDRKLLVA